MKEFMNTGARLAIRGTVRNSKRDNPARDCGACCADNCSEFLCRLRPDGRHEVSGRQTATSGRRKSGGSQRYAELGVSRLNRRTVAHHVHRRQCSVR